MALKVLKPELAAVVGSDRFLADIRTTANLQHPQILPLFDSGEADGFLFYVMPFVEGESLHDRLDRERQLPVEEAIAVASDVAEALDHAHGRGVIHRDIKPANILLLDGRAIVSDFGIALAVSATEGRLTETGLSVGTPYYMSPEQATGEQRVTAASDVYSLGCVLYEMLVSLLTPGARRRRYSLGSSWAYPIARRLTAGRFPFTWTPPSTGPWSAFPPTGSRRHGPFAARCPTRPFVTAAQWEATAGEPRNSVGRGGRPGSGPRSRPWRSWGPGRTLGRSRTRPHSGRSLSAGVSVGRGAGAVRGSLHRGLERRGQDRLRRDVRRGNSDLDSRSKPAQRSARAGHRGGHPTILLARRRRDRVREPPARRPRDRRPRRRRTPHPGTGWGSGGWRGVGRGRLRLLRLGSTRRADASGDDGRCGARGRPRVRGRRRGARACVALPTARRPRRPGDCPAEPRGGSRGRHGPGTGALRTLAEGVLGVYSETGHLVYVERDGSLLAAPFDPTAMELTGPPVLLEELGGGFSADLSLSGTGRLVYSMLPPPVLEVAWVERDGTMVPIDPICPCAASGSCRCHPTALGWP